MGDAVIVHDPPDAVLVSDNVLGSVGAVPVTVDRNRLDEKDTVLVLLSNSLKLAGMQRPPRPVIVHWQTIVTGKALFAVHPATVFVSGAKHSALALHDPQGPAETEVAGKPVACTVPLTLLHRSNKTPIAPVRPVACPVPFRHIHKVLVQLFSMTDM